MAKILLAFFPSMLALIVSCDDSRPQPANAPVISFVQAPSDAGGLPGSMLSLKALARTTSKEQISYIWEKLGPSGKTEIATGPMLNLTLPALAKLCDVMTEGYKVIAIAGSLSAEHAFIVETRDDVGCGRNVQPPSGDLGLSIEPGTDLWLKPGEKITLTAKLNAGASASINWEQLKGDGSATSLGNTATFEYTAPPLSKNCESDQFVLQVTATSKEVSSIKAISIQVASPSCTLTTSDGLVANECTRVLSLKGDRIAVGTESGLSLFDGKTWKKFTQAGNKRPLLQVTALAEAPDGDVWVGNALYYTYFGLDGQGIERLKPNLLWETTAIEPKIGLQGKLITQMSFDADASEPTVVVATQSDQKSYGGVTQASISFSSAAILLSNLNIFATIRDVGMNRWFGSDSSGIFVFKDTQQIANFAGPEWNGVGTFYDNRSIRAMHKDADGNIWIGLSSGRLASGGLVRFEPEASNPLAGIWSTTPESLPKNSDIRALATDAQDNLWIATDNGLAVKKSSDGTIVTLTTQEGLASNDVRDVHYDPASRFVWAATSKGLTRFTLSLLKL